MILAVTGLASEASIARRAGLEAVCAGGDPARTEAALAAALARGGVTGALSFGIAGGLAPELRPGSLIVADTVLGEGERFPVAPLGLAAHGTEPPDPAARAGAVWGAPLPAATAAEKALLHRRTGALAVDLESLVVARLAARAGIPCWVVRAIADPAERSLPPAALVPLRGNGHPDLPRVLRSVAGEPWQVPALIRLAVDTRLALVALAGTVPRLQRVFGTRARPSG